MVKLLYIAAGGAIGSVLRYLLASATQGFAPAGGAFPVGILTVNVLGCLAIGFLATLFHTSMPVREEHRFLILTGLLGGFTTFSSYAWDTLKLSTDGAVGAAVLNVLLSNALGLAAAWVGHRMCLWVVPA